MQRTLSGADKGGEMISHHNTFNVMSDSQDTYNQMAEISLMDSKNLSNLNRDLEKSRLKRGDISGDNIGLLGDLRLSSPLTK